jgi:hypothetical protein
MSSRSCDVCGKPSGGGIVLQWCDFCKAYLCQACKRRWLARLKAGATKIVTGTWTDDTGKRRTGQVGPNATHVEVERPKW